MYRIMCIMCLGATRFDLRFFSDSSSPHPGMSELAPIPFVSNTFVHESEHRFGAIEAVVKKRTSVKGTEKGDVCAVLATRQIYQTSVHFIDCRSWFMLPMCGLYYSIACFLISLD